jgi:Family of unknown function (DUF6441)
MPRGFKFTVKTDPLGLYELLRDKQRAVATASVAALREASADAVEEGRSNIAGAGRFGDKWQAGLRRRMVGATEGGEPSLQAKAIIFHKFGIAGIFEHGGTIEGKPLLWIPTTPGAPPASRSGKKLVSATVRGHPMLFDANDKDRHRKPLYIGVPSVRIPKKFRITEIVEAHAARIGELFLQHFKEE